MEKYTGKERRSLEVSAESIAERKKQKDAMRLAIVMNNASDAIIIQDIDGRITAWNRGAERMYGYTEEEGLKMNIDQLTPPEKLAEQKEFFQRLIAGEAGDSFETHRVAKDGSIVDVWLTVTKVLEEPVDSIISTDQEVVSLSGFAMLERNITARKQAENESRELLSMLELVPSGVIVHDVDGKILYVNQETMAMHGYSHDEFMALDLSRISSPESKEMITERMRETIDHGEASFEVKDIKKDGGIIFLLVKVKQIAWKGKNVFLSTQTDITERKENEEQLQKTLESLRKAVNTTVQVMVSAIEARDPYTAGHQIRSANLAHAIATEMGLSKEKIDGISMAGSIHDIGKLSIPSEILTKPTKLTNLEFSMIKEHSEKGFEMLKNVESPWPLAQIIYQHHERMDGSGYPRQLKGEDIIIEARILAVANVVEAMASHRPYRASLGIDAALAEIEKNKGILYDSKAADACLKIFKEGKFKFG